VVCFPLDIYYPFETFFQEIDLQVERPSFHVVVKIGQIWIVFYGFVFCFPVVVFGQKPGECGFTTSDVSCNSYMHNKKFKVKVGVEPCKIKKIF
jgi:hypothetical protein